MKKLQPLFMLIWMVGLGLMLSHPDLSRIPVKADLQESPTVTEEEPSLEEEPSAVGGIFFTGSARTDHRIAPLSLTDAAWNTGRPTWLTTIFYQSNYLSPFPF
ncbi:hypothetical protein JF544_01080 [Halobacillus kuroshimensis]|uniref:Uncharacterized protein n=1 Tax=Halobacillus kuroshimensis TaxID=302481 RepID=A0ABS3DR84_9BACI|nr:hypothetical protein [Halobacillus kuroshimensis]MBN8233814.1 hypothetical protein [Halobacillus kuroshimensis]